MTCRLAASPLTTWFAGPAALESFRRRWLGRTPVVLRSRDRAWRAIAPDFATVVAMAESGAPFQIVAERRYDRSGNPRRLGAALAAGATIFLPQVHQLLPRLMRLMVALRGGILGPLRQECSFLFAVEGRDRPGMGLHHDGPVDAFWLQLEGRRLVTLGPRVTPGTPEDLDPRTPRHGRGWRTLELRPGTLFHLPPWTPHDVVCRDRSLALSLTWRQRDSRRRATPAAHRAGLVAWDVVSGRVDAVPPCSRSRLWTQLPAVTGPSGPAEFSLVTPDGALRLPTAARSLAQRLALMPSFPLPAAANARSALAPLLEHGIVAPHELPLRIIPTDPRALDGWRFA
ncbi:MAG TPA: cupin domain-containing protein [Methylomirabilota bacterium]|nr:cupin domain-containing protein [Methylomirabilota bacterium]